MAGIFGDSGLAQLLNDPMTGLAFSLLAQPTTGPRGERLRAGQQIGQAGLTALQWQQALAKMQAEQRAQQQAQAQQAQQQAFLEALRGGEFRTPTGELDWERAQEAGVLGGMLPFEAGLRIQESRERREQSAQQAQTAAEQRREMQQERLEAQRERAAQTTSIGAMNAQTQRMFAEARLQDLQRAQQMSPHRNLPSYKSGLGIIAKQAEKLPEVADAEASVRRWLQLNETATTGPLAGRSPQTYFDPVYQELRTLENRLAMNNFKPGQGQMSNIEREYIKGGGPQVTKDVQANRNIAAIYLGAIENATEFVDFQQAWLEAKGTLGGAASAWRKYLDDNPRFIPDTRTKELVPNAKRQDWNTYFSNTTAPPTRREPAPPQEEVVELERGPDGKLRPKTR